MQKNIQHIFFDLDHTLWDFETNSAQTLHDLYYKLNINILFPNISASYFFERYSHHNSFMWMQYELKNIGRAELRVGRFLNLLKELGHENYNLAQELAEVYLQILPTKTALFDNAIHVLEYLKNKNYAMHIITNGFEEVQYKKLTNSNLTPFFTKIITSEKAQSNKPDKEIFEYAFSVTGAETHNSIMIGDNPNADIAGAININMASIWFNNTNQVSEVKPSYQINNLLEIKNIL